MGSWFSNIHIRKGETITQDTVVEAITKLLEGNGYCPSSTEDDAEGSVAILFDEHSGWFSVYSEILIFEDPEHFSEMAIPISRQLQTDVLGISCFDSDYLYLNLINANSKINAWVGIGNAGAYDIHRRTNLAAWKTKVENFSYFSEYAKKRYVFAEEFLANAERCLALPQAHGAANFEDLQDLGLSKDTKYLYFKPQEGKKLITLNTAAPEEDDCSQETQLTIDLGYPPCFPEKMYSISVRNTGGASKGLSICFLGPYVENDEITFSDTVFRQMRNGIPQSTPFELQKVRLADGQWAYRYHDPDYEIPPKPPKFDVQHLNELLKSKQITADREYGITIAFIPHGNRRKSLDITVSFIPDENPEGQVSWNVWKRFGSKEAFFKNNKQFAQLPGCELYMLREEDFD